VRLAVGDTGVGMTVLDGIVESHGGRVVVTSAPGKGTTLELVFPAAADLDDAGHDEAYTLLDPGESRALLPQGHGETAVVVDDEPAVRAVVERTVRQLGHAVRAFDDSRRALAYLAEVGNAADVLVSDQTMPGMTGDVLARPRASGVA
jgi:hypothetical protein